MDQTFGRKLKLVFGAAVLASMSFGIAQVKASPTDSADSRLACRPGYVECNCGEGPYCVKGNVCPHCP